MSGKAILIVMDSAIDADLYAADLKRRDARIDPLVIGWPPDPDEIRTLLEPT